MRARQAYGSSMHRRMIKHAGGSLEMTTKGPQHAKPSAKNGKARVRRYDKRSQKNVEKRERET